MADVICRWRNPSPKTVVELVSLLPKKPMSSKEFRKHVEAQEPDFFHTPYQLACQLGLYYEGKDGYIPRFSRDITTQEAQQYLEFWITRYYAPNPFTRSLTTLTEPVLLLESLVKYLEDHGGSANLKTALTYIFKDPMGNLDIVANSLNQYSKIIKVANDTASLSVNYKQLMEQIPDRKDKMGFFFFFDANAGDEGSSFSDATLQKIFYGCPGTGKSYKVKGLTEGHKGEKTVYFDETGAKVADINAVQDKSKITSNVFRTTFHPDYDYSTFVGSYKPVMNPVLDDDGKETGNEDLAYEFVPQVFTNAYVRAWKSLVDETLSDAEKQVYLIIEEINRGNCAQIFGDLFQLLDRKNGRSEFSIIPDAELRKHLAKEGLESNKLILPENLHILATMNTSDQSLFPMDSAFKRRWAMEYVPINLEQEKAREFTYKVNGEDYSWVEFLGKVNPLIRKATDSEDKQMGEFFIKDHATEEEFLNKVMFYIWNDVCKDLYSASRISPLYFMRSAEGDDKKDVFTFAELFGKGRLNEEDNTYTAPVDLLEGFITKYLGLKALPKKEQE
jgi:GTPase subunit of restriction endonuclease